jgi:hypothetical protein
MNREMAEELSPYFLINTAGSLKTVTNSRYGHHILIGAIIIFKNALQNHGWMKNPLKQFL